MSSRIRIRRLPLRKAARAIRAVSSGTGSIGDGRIDIGSLLQGVPCLNTPISPNDQQYQSWRVGAGSRPAAHATPDHARRCLRPNLDDVNLEDRQSELGCRFAQLTPCGLAAILFTLSGKTPMMATPR